MSNTRNYRNVPMRGIATRPSSYSAPYSYGMNGLGNVSPYPRTIVGGLMPGDRGGNVKPLQEMLIKAGYSVGASGADGIYGENTRKAVYDFELANGIPADGILGGTTWTRLWDLTQGGTVSVPRGSTAPASAPTATPSPSTSSTTNAPQPSAGAAPQQSTSAPNSGSIFGNLFSSPTPQPSAGATPQQNTTQQQPNFFEQLAPVASNIIRGLSPQQQQQTTPPLLPQQSQQPQQQRSTSTAPQVSQTSPQQRTPVSGGTVLVEVESPAMTALRIGASAALGVGAGWGIQAMQEKPNTILSVVGGAAVGVGSYFAGTAIFPPTKGQVIQAQTP